MKRAVLIVADEPQADKNGVPIAYPVLAWPAHFDVPEGFAEVDLVHPLEAWGMRGMRKSALESTQDAKDHKAVAG